MNPFTTSRVLFASAPGPAALCIASLLFLAACPGSPGVGKALAQDASVLSSVCAPGDSGPCDDGDNCTFNDHCAGAVCSGQPSIVPASCLWTVVAGGASGGKSTLRGNVSVAGSICGKTTRVGTRASVRGNVAATAESGSGADFGPDAAVGGDVVTGGAPITASPAFTRLPGMATSFVPGGTCDAQNSDPACLLDASGANPMADDCRQAAEGIRETAKRLDSLAFRSTMNLGATVLAQNKALKITATQKVNVVDFVRLVVGNNSVIVLDGNSIPGVTFILRVNTNLDMHLRSQIALIHGASAARVVVYGRGRCNFGEFVTGAGTIVCPYTEVTLDQSSKWQGAVISGGGSVDVRRHADLFHVALEVTLPAQ